MDAVAAHLDQEILAKYHHLPENRRGQISSYNTRYNTQYTFTYSFEQTNIWVLRETSPGTVLDPARIARKCRVWDLLFEFRYNRWWDGRARQYRAKSGIERSGNEDEVGKPDYGGVIGDEIGERRKQFLHLRQVGFAVGLGMEISAENEARRGHRGVARE